MDAESNYESSLHSVFPLIARGVMQEVEQIVAEEGKLTDESLLAMHAVFGTVLERALMLVDKNNSIVELQSPAGRRLLQITGSAHGVYTVFPDVNFCPCTAYQHHVLATHSQVTCKHILAGWLACILNKQRTLPTPEDTLTSLMHSMVNATTTS